MNFEQERCVVITCFSADQPGFLDFSYRLAALAKRYRVTIVSAAPLAKPELQVAGEYVVLPCTGGRSGWLSYLWQCGQLLRARKPDVAVLLHSAAAPVALLAGRTPTVTYWNEHPTHLAPSPESFSLLRVITRSAIRWLCFEGARRSSVVMPIGEAHRADLLDRRCDPDRVHMQYMGVDNSFHRVAIPDRSVFRSTGALRLLYVGTVNRPRGRDVMLEALVLANRNGRIAELTLVGASPEQQLYCAERARQLGITTYLRVVGRVPGSEIPGFMREADAGLCLWEDKPWWRFNPPTKLFEYLVAGLPVLASNIRTHTEYIRDQHNGLVFEYGADGLAQAIGRLSAMGGEIVAMKKRAAASGENHLWPAIEPDFIETVRGAT